MRQKTSRWKAPPHSCVAELTWSNSKVVHGSRQALSFSMNAAYPVCAHMGLTPQAINRLGGYRVQGRNPDQATAMIEEAKILQDAGASILLLECVPTNLGKEITETLDIPVIGIGAGPHTDGQIMVMHDMLGITPTSIRVPKFVKNFMPESTDGGIKGAFEAYALAVHEKTLPRA